MLIRNKVAAIFVSDLHLGTRSSQDGHFLDFLKSYEAKTLYLVGDVIDGWRLRRSGWYWPQGHLALLPSALMSGLETLLPSKFPEVTPVAALSA